MTEILFWEAKCMNLESLYEQMKADTTKKMASILDMTDSAYYPCFRSMFRNVVAALNEARDITLYLKPLATHFEVDKKKKANMILLLLSKISEISSILFAIVQATNFLLFFFQAIEILDFPDVTPTLRPLMHCVCLVYSNSQYYNSPARIIVLMQETCNMLIDSARKYIDPASLFQVFNIPKNCQNDFNWTE